MSTFAVLNTSQIWGEINPTHRWGAAFGILVALLSKKTPLSCKEKLEALQLFQNEGLRNTSKQRALTSKTALRWTIREIQSLPKATHTAILLKNKARLGTLNDTQTENIQKIANLAEEAAARDSERLARKHNRLAQQIRCRAN